MTDLDPNEDITTARSYTWTSGGMGGVPNMGVSTDVKLHGTVTIGGFEVSPTAAAPITVQDLMDGMAAFYRTILDRHQSIVPGSPPDDGGFTMRISRQEQQTVSYEGSAAVERDPA